MIVGQVVNDDEFNDAWERASLRMIEIIDNNTGETFLAVLTNRERQYVVAVGETLSIASDKSDLTIEVRVVPTQEPQATVN